MASSGFRGIRTAILLGFLAVGAGCMTTPAAPAPQSPETSTLPAQAFEAGVELPPGPGRELLVTACLVCHELTAIELFKGFYTRDDWRSLIVTMRANGAEVDDADIDVLAGYLGVNFGQSSP